MDRKVVIKFEGELIVTYDSERDLNDVLDGGELQFDMDIDDGIVEDLQISNFKVEDSK